MKLAILGFGTMGRMFARLVLRNLQPEDTLAIANRTVSRMKDLAREYPRVAATGDFAEACAGADIAIIAVSPMASREVLEAIAPSLKPTCLLVSFVADFSIANIGKFFAGKVIRLVPTITSYADRGVTLVAPGKKADERDVERVRSLVAPPLRLEVVDESKINDYSMATSCGPGIVSALLGELSRAYAHAAGLDEREIERMVTETAAAACEYAASSGKCFERILSEVATKGGITEAGATVIGQKTGPVFAEMIDAMKIRHIARGDKIDALFDR